jgi:hypothetical protein
MFSECKGTAIISILQDSLQKRKTVNYLLVYKGLQSVTFVTRYLPGVSTRTLGARVYNVYVYIIMYYKIIYYTPPYYIIPHAGKLPKSNK